MGSHRCEDCGNEYIDAESLRVHYESSSCSKDGQNRSKDRRNRSKSRDTDNSGPTLPPNIDWPIKDIKGFVKNYFGDQGYGFLRTFDIPTQGEEVHPQSVFFHVSNIDEFKAKKGWQLKGDVVENDEGLALKNGRVVSKDNNRDFSEDETKSHNKRLGFGSEVDDEKKNPGRKPNPTADEDIEDHQDDRKFR